MIYSDNRKTPDEDHRLPSGTEELTRVDVEDFLAWLKDGNEGEAPLPKRASKLGPAQRKLRAKRLFNERLLKWGVPKDELRPAKVRESFLKLSSRLSVEALENILETAEIIANAETTKGKWNPKVNAKLYKRLSRVAISAANLATEIAEMFPQPWETERKPIGVLVAGLASLATGAVTATWRGSGQALLDIRKAGWALSSTRRLLIQRTGKRYSELLTDLTWLALGTRRVRPNERTIRRYLEEPRLPSIPERRYWNCHWSDLVSIEKLVPAREPEPFEAAALHYLTSF